MTNELIGVIEGEGELVGLIDDAQPVIQVEIQGAGPQGKPGFVWTPKVDEEGWITWEEDDGQTQPEPANIKGPKGEETDVIALSTFTHEQGQPAKVWNISHNLGFYPSVAVVTYGGNQIIGGVDYIDKNELTVSFAVKVSGYAYLS